MLKPGYVPEALRTRTKDQLKAEAQSLDKIMPLVVNPAEFRLIAREIGLAYRWHGRHVAVTSR